MQQSQLLKGALDLAVVAALADHESYGYEVLQRLTDAGLAGVGDASVYGVLKRLETMSVLSSQLVPSVLSRSCPAGAPSHFGMTSLTNCPPRNKDGRSNGSGPCDSARCRRALTLHRSVGIRKTSSDERYD